MLIPAELVPASWRRWLTGLLWDPGLAGRPPLRRGAVRALRVAVAVGGDLASGQIALRAMSLVYTTLLALVPLLAVSFSVLKAFGVHNQAGPLLERFLAPLGSEATEVSARILGFVENVRIGVLGSLGLALLFYTVISVLQKIEAAFNELWRVSRARRLSRRFSDYLSVLLIGPVLVFSALGLTASLLRNSVVQRALAIEPLGSLVLASTRLLPYVLVTGAFAFVYTYLTNTRVRPWPALAGAASAGILWQTTGWGFAAFVAGSGSYAAIYSGFAILVLFLIWLYLSWLILLVGADVAFYAQNPQFALPAGRRLRLGAAQRERLGLAVLYLVAERHLRGGPGFTAEALSQRLGLPAEVVNESVEALVQTKLLAQTSDEPPRLLPGRDASAIPLDDALRQLRDSGAATPIRMPVPAVERLATTLDEAVRQTLGERTLRDLVEDRQSPAGKPSEAD